MRPARRPAGEAPPETCFLGVDGGGSKTLAVIVDAAGAERGRGLAGCANYQAIGRNAAVAQISLAVEAAAVAAGYRAPFAAAWLGLAGVDSPRDHTLLLPQLRTLAETVRLTNDAELALGALTGCVGVALVAGTGSIALGRSASGTQARAGGWGHLLGDEGSGYDIGRRALQAATQAADGRGPPTQLLARILDAWELHATEDILGRVYPLGEKAAIALLSRLVFEAAQAGDRVASEIARRAAAELAQTALTVGKALGFDAGGMPLALGGGLLLHEANLRRDVLRLVRRRQTVGPVVLVGEPALSAARAAIACG
ncbi:MAG TPA: BadF/BadG/BcrA/BcrD ATPase family protein [Ktedonobacterales bacterium]|nr:BadF/BadG/BcrA/BcrD ATPase family protein [Ktedonobacterales bacterium]